MPSKPQHHRFFLPGFLKLMQSFDLEDSYNLKALCIKMSCGDFSFQKTKIDPNCFYHLWYSMPGKGTLWDHNHLKFKVLAQNYFSFDLYILWASARTIWIWSIVTDNCWMFFSIRSWSNFTIENLLILKWKTVNAHQIQTQSPDFFLIFA